MSLSQIELTYLAGASVIALVASYFDVKSRRIPNFITVPAFLFGLFIHLVCGGWQQMLTSLAAGAIGGALFLVFYLAGGMGAGDVKLIMAVGATAGLPHIAYLLVLTVLAGGLMALFLTVVRGRLQQTIMNVGVLTAHHAQQGLQPHPDLNIANPQTLRLPYALAIAGGCILTLYFQFQ